MPSSFIGSTTPRNKKGKCYFFQQKDQEITQKPIYIINLMILFIKNFQSISRRKNIIMRKGNSRFKREIHFGTSQLIGDDLGGINYG